jgi:hypothetical protein
MNAAEIVALLRHPEALAYVDRSVLEKLVQEYPYFQTAHLLAAKKAHIDNDINLESKLTLAAAYASDRIRLYEWMNQRAVTEKFLPEEKKEAQNVELVPERDLDELLQSVHELKQQVLSNMQSAEDALRERQIQEGNGLTGSIETAEEFIDGELLLVNSVGGAGSEYLPMEETPEEEAPNNFVEETDPEIESNSVIEEEFVLHDLDMELKEQEIRSFSQAESILQVEAESQEGMTTIPDTEMESWRRMEMEWEEMQHYNTQEELININETAGGGSEFVQLEMSEEENPREQPLELISEAASVFSLENDQKEEETVDAAPANDFRISEEVKSPGEFLPEKSHSFLEWLQFFKPETPGKKKVTMEKNEIIVAPDEKETVLEPTPLVEPIPPRSGMKDELDAIDRIVSSSSMTRQTGRHSSIHPNKWHGKVCRWMTTWSAKHWRRSMKDRARLTKRYGCMRG